MNSLSNMVKVAVVGGEGIGPEVTDIAEPGSSGISTEQMGDAVLNALEQFVSKETENA